MLPFETRKLIICSSIQEYCSDPVDREQFEMLEEMQQECAEVLRDHDWLRIAFACAAGVLFFLVVVMMLFSDFPLLPEDEYLPAQISLLLGVFAGAALFFFMVSRIYAHFLPDTECSITIGGLKVLHDRGSRKRNDHELARAYQVLKPVKLGHNRSNLHPMVATLLKNIDSQKRQVMTFELELIHRLAR